MPTTSAVLTATLLSITLLTVPAGRAAEPVPIPCGGAYKYHLQGACSDDQGAYFWCFTTWLVKTDRTGKILKQVEVANHHGDLCYHDGKVYVALNLGKFNDPKGNANSWVYVYDAENLTCVAKHKTAEIFHGAGGIAFHAGKFLVVGGLPHEVNENYVYEYTPEFQFVRKHTLAGGHTHLGIQTAAFADGHWWFGCYGRPKSATAPATPPILLKVSADLQRVERFEFDCAVGIVPAGMGQFLIARDTVNREKQHTAQLIPAVPDPMQGLKLVPNR
ncbi:MAG: hypothetical protein LC104_16670 [Bacteroidales bacterium]|nr:hypothetical protein [Bacteroidales bacterium]